MAAYNPVQARFDEAIRDFKRKLDDDRLYDEIRNFKSAEDVYEATDKLQAVQGRDGHLRHLSKIGPFLERMQDYSEAIKTFVQVKPDILALIWGPIRLLLQWTSVLKQSFDTIINTTAEIGDLLPEFAEVTKLFDQNTQLKDVLGLFFEDVLDFYLVTLKFFKTSRLRNVFEAFWPRQRDRINLVTTSIKRHAMLMRNEVRLEHIREEHQARVEALAHFEKTEKINIQQEHETIRNALCPRSYDDKLNWYRGRVCDGTNEWLTNNLTFIKWLDPNDDSVRLLWLQGIPGSGKTFLAGAVIDKSQVCGRTTFAFLTHAYASNTTALSVIHSLIFQLTFDNLDLQAALCQCSRENIGSSVTVATTVLSTLLSSLEKTYVIIDGLDEIDKVERGRLLDQILEISKACSKTKMLIASRAESDISAKVSLRFHSIHVNDHNESSIRAFVTRKTTDFLASKDFLPDEKIEIEALLAPIGSNAKGMFLYAKILLDCIELLHDVDSIRDELKVLPEDLHDAYQRILSRINTLRSSTARHTARQVIGWIGCSPTPLTIREIEQALTVKNNDETTLAPMRGSLNLIELCGPIVEVEDGYARFVHFTVKEYMFNKDIDGYVDLIDATLDLTKRCIYYLCKEHFDDWLEPDEIKQHLFLGSYRLHYYALMYWFELTIQSIVLASHTVPHSLVHCLELLVNRRSNYDFNESPIASDHTNIRALKEFDQENSHVAQMLYHVERYNQQILGSAIHLKDVEDWKWPAPFTMNGISWQIHEIMNQLVCLKDKHVQDCSCTLIKRHYGPNHFKCGYVECPDFRKGFSSRSVRASHEKLHAKPWKCNESTCEYAEIGFLSQRMRDEHSSCHKQAQMETNNVSQIVSHSDSDGSMLIDLIRLNKVAEIDALLTRYPILDHNHTVWNAAASYGSSAVAQLILSRSHGMKAYQLSELLYISVENGNVESLRVIKSQVHGLTQYDYPFILRALLCCKVAEARQECESMLLDPTLFLYRDGRLCRDWHDAVTDMCLDRVWKWRMIDQLKDRTDNEVWLASFWKKLSKKSTLPKQLVDLSFQHVIAKSPSIFLAKQLLRYGAAVDYRQCERSLTLLHRAARATNEQSARMMKFLLYHGANPEARCTRAKLAISEEKGAKNIAKWLNMSWEQLVEKVKSDRARGYCPPEYRLDSDDLETYVQVETDNPASTS